jgi:VIT1/CCC1 family predicted Fe2+/Mn2+ transporter
MGRSGWLRPAVLGANDGIVSVASLILGVASASADRHAILVAGAAGLAAGAMSMAAGEYVSVSSQADTERASLAREREELAADPAGEAQELAAIYVARGLDPPVAREVAARMMAKDALGAHARDELGILEVTTARPIQAAAASVLSFAAGAIVPLLVSTATPLDLLRPVTATVSLLLLATLGALGARAGGAPAIKAAARVAFWGAVAMAVTSGLGALFDGR